MVDDQHRFPAPRKSEIFPEASTLLCYSLGLVGLAESVLLLGAWGDGTVSSVRNPGFLQSEGETLPGLEFHFFCCCLTGWLVCF